MIADFIDSWGLFHNSYLAGLLSSAILSLLGVFVVARNQIFVGAAVAQSSTFGIAVGLWLGTQSALSELAIVHSKAFLTALGVLFSIMALLLVSLGIASRKRAATGESPEAITGSVFIFSGSMSVLLLAHSPHALEEVHHLVTSTIIGATTKDVFGFIALGLICCGLIWRHYRSLLLIAIDEQMALVSGVRVQLIQLIFGIGLAVALGFSIRVAGITFTFACLVLPPLIARGLSPELGRCLITSPIVAVSCNLGAFILANYFDLPPAQVAAVLFVLVYLATISALRSILSHYFKGGISGKASTKR